MSIQHNASLGSGEAGIFKDAGHVYVRLMNLIFDPSVPYTKNYNSSSDILKTGLLCTMEKIGFSVDTEQGFYEHKNHFIPKMFTLDFEFKYAGSTPNFGSPLDSNGLLAGNAGDGGTWPFGMNWIPNQAVGTLGTNTSEQQAAQTVQQMSPDVAAEYNPEILLKNNELYSTLGMPTYDYIYNEAGPQQPSPTPPPPEPAQEEPSSQDSSGFTEGGLPVTPPN